MTVSTVNAKLSLLPEGSVCGSDTGARPGDAAPLVCEYFVGNTTFDTRISIRHDPIASDVYRQRIGAVQEEDSFRDKGPREMRALPINEYAGAGLS